MTRLIRELMAMNSDLKQETQTLLEQIKFEKQMREITTLTTSTMRSQRTMNKESTISSHMSEGMSNSNDKPTERKHPRARAIPDSQHFENPLTSSNYNLNT